MQPYSPFHYLRPFAILGAVLLWRRRTRAAWLSAIAAALTVVQLAIDDVPVLWRSSAPTAFSSTVERAVVSVVLGIGVGLILALPVLLTRHRAEARPWTGARPTRVSRPSMKELAAVLDGPFTLRLPGEPAAPGAVSIDTFLETTFAHLRVGF